MKVDCASYPFVKCQNLSFETFKIFILIRESSLFIVIVNFTEFPLIVNEKFTRVTFHRLIGYNSDLVQLFYHLSHGYDLTIS